MANLTEILKLLKVLSLKIGSRVGMLIAVMFDECKEIIIIRKIGIVHLSRKHPLGRTLAVRQYFLLYNNSYE